MNDEEGAAKANEPLRSIDRRKGLVEKPSLEGASYRSMKIMVAVPSSGDTERELHPRRTESRRFPPWRASTGESLEKPLTRECQSRVSSQARQVHA